MNEDHELSRLEKEWKNSFDRFTAPEPSREQTLNLIEKIKEADVGKPVDMRATLEAQQETQSFSSKVASLFLSQWNFHGARSWLLTGIVLLILTITINQNGGDAATDFITWIKWITLIIIAGMGYAFRSKNEGNEIIETLSYYPLVQQMFTRFIIVMAIQLAITLPLSFLILRERKFGFVFIEFIYADSIFRGRWICCNYVVWPKNRHTSCALCLVCSSSFGEAIKIRGVIPVAWK